MPRSPPPLVRFPTPQYFTVKADHLVSKRALLKRELDHQRSNPIRDTSKERRLMSGIAQTSYSTYVSEDAELSIFPFFSFHPSGS